MQSSYQVWSQVSICLNHRSDLISSVKLPSNESSTRKICFPSNIHGLLFDTTCNPSPISTLSSTPLEHDCKLTDSSWTKFFSFIGKSGSYVVRQLGQHLSCATFHCLTLLWQQILHINQHRCNWVTYQNALVLHQQMCQIVMVTSQNHLYI